MDTCIFATWFEQSNTHHCRSDSLTDQMSESLFNFETWDFFRYIFVSLIDNIFYFIYSILFSGNNNMYELELCTVVHHIRKLRISRYIYDELAQYTKHIRYYGDLFNEYSTLIIIAILQGEHTWV